MSSAWQCPRCRHNNPAEIRFCSNCGAAQPVAAGYPRWLWPVALGLWVLGCLIIASGVGLWWLDQESSPVAAVPPAAGGTEAAPTAPLASQGLLTPTATPLPVPGQTSEPPTEATPAAPAAPTPAPPVLDQATPSGGDGLVLPTTSGGDRLKKPTSTRVPASPTPPRVPTTPTPPPLPATPTPQPIAAAPPTSSPAGSPTCPSPGVQITAPVPGTVFREREVVIAGTANINRFHHWRIEYATSPGAWNFLFERDYPVDNDKLMTLDTSTVPNGPYGLRLTVVDDTGNYPQPCEVWYTNGY